ncbi:MAG: hypothetical protein OEX09_08765 [Candidatus Bathyarchaeota archaeon]|nr:hypothetical protein [Candidatus Bathyarchaeota archaeon]
MKNLPEEEKATLLVNFKLHRNVVKVLDRLVESGLYKTRVDIVLSALRIYKPFQDMWKKEVVDAAES